MFAVVVDYVIETPIAHKQPNIHGNTHILIIASLYTIRVSFAVLK